jgi:hypothetical protein
VLNDPIVEEIRRIRDEHAARFNYDLDAIFDDIKKSEKELGLPLVLAAAKDKIRELFFEVVQGH